MNKVNKEVREDWKEKFSDWLINNLQMTSKSNVELIVKHVEHYYVQPPSEGSGEVGLQDRIHEVMEEDGGIWQPCSGCHETVDGQETGHYNYSDTFKCYQGSGCRECGGIGVTYLDGKFLKHPFEEYTLPSNSEYYPDDLQNQVREHINQHDLFDWHEALSENEMTLLENLLLTFAPEFPQGSIGYEKANKWHRLPSNSNVEGRRFTLEEAVDIYCAGLSKDMGYASVRYPIAKQYFKEKFNIDLP